MFVSLNFRRRVPSTRSSHEPAERGGGQGRVHHPYQSVYQGGRSGQAIHVGRNLREERICALCSCSPFRRGVTSLDFVGDMYGKETRDAEAIVYKVVSVQGDMTCSALGFDVHCGGGQRGRHDRIMPYAPE